MAKDKDPNDTDQQAFLDAMRDVQPLKPNNRIVSKPPKRSPTRRKTSPAPHDTAPAWRRIDASHMPALTYQASGIQDRVMRQLKRGQLSMDATIDLHGLHLDEAHTEIHRALNQCLMSGKRYLLVIFGKGLRSGETGPILKPNVLNWLQSHPQVLAYAPALPKDGGTGATYLLLKKQKNI